MIVTHIMSSLDIFDAGADIVIVQANAWFFELFDIICGHAHIECVTLSAIVDDTMLVLDVCKG